MNDRAALVIVAVAVAVRLGLGFHLALLADEAYYWVWAQHPALGYYDQPPLIAWIIAATTALADTEGLVRIGAIACAAIGPLVLWPFAGDRALLALIWCAPVLFGLTLFATPDAPLLAAWAITLAAACAGGRWWLLAGAAAGLAFLSKYSGAAVLPLAVLAAGRDDWRTPWPWAALAVAGAVAAPNLLWNAEHGWVSFAFQLHEGLLHPRTPGAAGLLTWGLDQLAVATPLLALAGAAWAIGSLRSLREDRIARLAWATSVPVLLLFAAAAPQSPAEAHWPAPAWVGLALGLSRSGGRIARAAWVGAMTAAGFTLVAALHVVHPLFPLRDDPATRLTEGPLVADAVAAWALPAGVGVADGQPGRAEAVYTERYQEAAFIHFYAGIPARRLPGCGREDQYTVWDDEAAASTALFVRPATGGPPRCLEGRYQSGGPHRLHGVDRFGRVAGNWQIFEVTR